MSNVEKEIKILLSKREYDVLCGLFLWSKDYMQVNHYYGYLTDKIIPQETFRVREKNGIKKIQVKIPQKYEGALHVKKEFEKIISDIPVVLSKDELKDIVGEDYDDKFYVGKLITWRKECIEYSGVKICLDKNEYLNTIDYEIEIEFSGNYPCEIIERLKKLGLNVENHTDGKNKRFFKKLYRIETI